MKIVGICSGHDVAYGILENGIPIIHNELERFNRKKGTIGDALQFLIDTYPDINDITHASYCVNTWKGGISKRYPDSFNKINSIVKNNNGKFWPNEDTRPGHHQCHAANAFFSSNFDKALIITIDGGGEDFTSDGKYVSSAFTIWEFKDNFHDMNLMSKYASESEQNQFDIAASLQQYTEDSVKEKIGIYLKKYPNKNLCLSGGVALNSVMTGKIRKWYPEIENVYMDPVPYDAGIALGGPRYIWHHILNNPRIKWEDNSTPYLGKTYSKEEVLKAIDKYNLDFTNTTDDYVTDLLIKQNVVSVFGGGSESGRRALGNRSILADPRSSEMKDIINEKVKHRQWFKWYYNFIKLFHQKTGVPILLNTSFNDREPIVETPQNALDCFLKTDIDYLYFRDYKILLKK